MGALGHAERLRMSDWYWTGVNWEPALDYEGRLPAGVGSGDTADLLLKWLDERLAEDLAQHSATSNPVAADCTPAETSTRPGTH